MITQKIKTYIARNKWRKKNSHNLTTIMFEIDPHKIVVGKGTYGELAVYNNDTDSMVIIGNYCSIGPGVTFLVGADHRMDHISTYPFKTKILNEKNEAISKGNIVIDDDVWIGYGATILSGVHISQGAVIAAGAVVDKDVPPYSVVGGVPAKVIKYRFDRNEIERLLKLDFSKLDYDLIHDHIKDLYAGLDDIESYDWMSKNK